MPYTIIDSMKDEVKLLREMEDWAKSNGKTITEAIYSVIGQSLNHIVMRLESGYDYNLATDKDGNVFVKFTKSNRKTLEEEYPALKKAAEQYDTIATLIDSTTK